MRKQQMGRRRMTFVLVHARASRGLFFVFQCLHVVIPLPQPQEGFLWKLHQSESVISHRRDDLSLAPGEGGGEEERGNLRLDEVEAKSLVHPDLSHLL